MVSGDICDEVESGTSILIDYSEGKITVENSNGSEPESFIFEMGDFVDIRTIGTELISHFRIEPNGGCGDNSGNGSGETGLEVESEDVQTEIEPEISSGSDLIDNQETGASVGIKPNIVQVVPSFREVTAGEIAEEIRDVVTLKRNESRILTALVKGGSATRNEISEITGIVISNVSTSIVRLIKLGLVYYESKKFIRPNPERVSVSCPWLYSKEIQEAILNIRPEADSKFGFGKHIEYILYLLCKHRDGLYKNTVIDGTGLKHLGLYNAEKILLKYNLIEVTGRGKKAIIFPKFSVSQIEENLAISQEPAITETDPVQEIAEAEEPTVNTDKKESVISQEPIVIETVPDPKTVEIKKATADFIEVKLLSLVSRIINGSSVGLHKISSDFGVKKNSERLVELLNVINKEVEIEIVEVDADEVTISWNQKYFKNIELENFLVRKFSGEQAKDERGQEEDTEEQEISPDLCVDSNTGSTESENNNIATEGEQTKDKGGLEEDKECIEQKATTDDIKPDEPPINKTMLKEVIEELKPEDIKKQIERMIATPNLGDPHKIVLSILLDNYLSNSSLKMEVSNLIENAIKQNLGEAQVRGCFGGLQALKFIKKPNQIIELSI
ncbi:MarR family transcriptional regulator [Candidatus Parcubacteria bacterium]|nr:MarR family transcriptional regulator [Candidatus Parcubacteria bacterium]